MKTLSILALVAATATPALAASGHNVSGHEKGPQISLEDFGKLGTERVEARTQIGTAPQR